MDKIIRAFPPLPAFARQSFTFVCRVQALEDGIGARSWFCDPSAPWHDAGRGIHGTFAGSGVIPDPAKQA